MKWIPIEKPFSLPEHVRAALQKLSGSGHVAYVVGGCVRDFLLDRPSKDYDIATSALPDEILALYPNALDVGKAFGVIKVPVQDRTELEIATFRKESEYKDFRRPSKVTFTGPEEDAKRRDFTINALFYDWKSQRILDCVGGIEDLKARRIQAIGDPSERFHEDALRLLRTVRFATQLGFEIEPQTWKSVISRHKLIKRVSFERIRDELDGIWMSSQPDRGLRLLGESGLLSTILPRVDELRKSSNLWAIKLKSLSLARKIYPSASNALIWSVFFMDLGPGAELLQVCQTLKLSNQEIYYISQMLEERGRFKEVFQMREATLIRWLKQSHFKELLMFHHVDALATDGNLAAYDFCLSRFEQLKREGELSRRPLLTGADLISLGFEPGPHFADILRMVEDLAFEKKIHTKEEALEFVLKKAVR